MKFITINGLGNMPPMDRLERIEERLRQLERSIKMLSEDLRNLCSRVKPEHVCNCKSTYFDPTLSGGVSSF